MFESISQFLSGSLASITLDAIAWALIHFLWQGTLIALVLRSLLAGLPQQLSNWRYGLSLAALVLMAILPMATAHYHVRSHAGASGVVQSADTSSDSEVAWIPASQPASSRAAAMPTDGGETAAAGLPSMLTQLQAQLQPRLSWVLSLWLLGVAFFGFQQAVAWRRIQTLVRNAGDAEPQLQAMLRQLADRLGIQQSVQVLSSHAIDVPTVVGMFKPVVLVPLGTLARLSTEQVEMILAHELAHVRRHDFAVNLLQTAIETLLFYHPAVWWVSAQVRREREHCCDDLAVHLLGDQRGYARALLELEETRTPSLAMAANGTPLLDRVRRLVGSPDAGQDSLGSTALVGVLSLTLLAMVLGLAHPVWGGDVPAPPAPPAPTEPPTPTAAPEASPTPSFPNAPAAPSAAVPPAAAPAAPVPAPRPTPMVAAPTVPAPALLTLPMALGSHGNEGVRTRGRFRLERRWGKVSLEMRGDTSSRFNMHTAVELAEFSDTQWTAAGRAVLKRQAGDLVFEGDFTAPGEGKGTFRFEPSAAFRSAMADRGYGDLTDGRQFELYLFDVGPMQVDELASLGFEDLSLQRLIELGIHDVDGDFIRSFQSVGYEDLDLETWIAFAIHDVTPSYVESMVDMGFEDIPAQRIVELHIHDVDPEFIHQVQSMGFDELSIQRLIELSIHDVDPDYMQAMADAGYGDLPLQKLIEFAIHDVNPRLVQGLADAGYRDLPAESIVQFAIHDVDPQFIQALADAGYRDLPAESIVEFAIHDVDPRLIQTLSDVGYRDLPPQRLVEFAIHDVEPEVITAFADLGYRDLTVERLVEFAVHDVTPRFVRDLSDLGYRDLSAQELVEFKIFDVTPRYVRRLQENGQQLTPRELVERRIHGGD